MKNIYEIEYTTYRVVEFDDEDMIRCGYSAPITDSDRQEYLDNLIEDGVGDFSDGDTIIRKIDIERIR